MVRKKRDKQNYLIVAACSVFFACTVFVYATDDSADVTETSDTSIDDAVQTLTVAQTSDDVISDEKDDDVQQDRPKDETTRIACEGQEVCEDKNDSSTQVANQDEEYSDELILVDRIVAKVDDTIITHSDQVRPGIDGEQHTLEELKDEALIYNKAKSYNMVFSEEAIERDLKKVAEDQGVSYVELKGIFEAAGCSEKEGRDKFAKMKAVNQLVSYKVMSRCIVPERDIVAYHEEHLEIIPVKYFLRNAVVPYAVDASERDKKELKKEIAAATKANIDSPLVKWGSPYWYEHDEIDEKQAFVYDLEVGEISAPYDTQRCFLIYQLDDKKEETAVPLDDRREEITDLLWKKKYAQLMGDFMEELRKGASVAYL